METKTLASTPPLSVIVVIFGGNACLPQCLDALVNQSDVEDIEIVVPYDDRIPDTQPLQQVYTSLWAVVANLLNI